MISGDSRDFSSRGWIGVVFYMSKFCKLLGDVDGGFDIRGRK